MSTWARLNVGVMKRRCQVREAQDIALIWLHGGWKSLSREWTTNKGQFTFFFFFLIEGEGQIFREKALSSFLVTWVPIGYPAYRYLHWSRANIILVTIHGSTTRLYAIQFFKELLPKVGLLHTSQPLSKEQEKKRRSALIVYSKLELIL